MITGTRTHRLSVFSMVMASFALAAILVPGVPAAKNCDAVPLPSVSEAVIIDWDPVTDQFFVQQGDVKFAVDLPPTVTEFHVPSENIALGGTFKLFEIVARATRRWKTASLSSKCAF